MHVPQRVYRACVAIGGWFRCDGGRFTGGTTTTTPTRRAGRTSGSPPSVSCTSHQSRTARPCGRTRGANRSRSRSRPGGHVRLLIGRRACMPCVRTQRPVQLTAWIGPAYRPALWRARTRERAVVVDDGQVGPGDVRVLGLRFGALCASVRLFRGWAPPTGRA